MRQGENECRIGFVGPNRQPPNSNQVSGHLFEGDPSTAVSDRQTVSDFVKPEEGNNGSVSGQSLKNRKTVATIRFVFEEPLKCERSVDDEIAHTRWPS